MTNFLDISHTRTLHSHYFFPFSPFITSTHIPFLSSHLITQNNTNGKHKRPTSILLELRRRRCIAGAQEEREPSQPGVGRLRS